MLQAVRRLINSFSAALSNSLALTLSRLRRDFVNFVGSVAVAISVCCCPKCSHILWHELICHKTRPVGQVVGGLACCRLDVNAAATCK